MSETNTNWTKKVNTREVEFRREQDGAESGAGAAYLYFAECPNIAVGHTGVFGDLTPRNQHGVPIETGYYGEYAEIHEPVDQRNDIVDIAYSPQGGNSFASYTPCTVPGQPRTAWYDSVMPDFILWVTVPGVPDAHTALTATMTTTTHLAGEARADIASGYQAALFPIIDAETGALVPEAVAVFIAHSSAALYIPQGVRVECAFTVTLSDETTSKDINFQCRFEEPAV